MPRKQFTAAQKAEYRATKAAEAREQVEKSVRALLTSDGWRHWVETRAKFRDYSVGNCLLIACQCPHATAVAGFRRWQELDRQVRKGEHAIRIMAPMVVGGDKEERRNVRKVGETLQPTSGEKMSDDSARILFRAVPVFDISQTDGEPLPTPPVEPITGDSHAPYIARLTDWARSQGITVQTGETGAAEGSYNDKTRTITLAPDRPANATVRTLVHELAHAVGVPTYKTHGRADAECIVETAGHIVCKSIGLDTSGEAIPYIAGWGEANDVKAIRQYAETVDKIARTLEEVCAA